MWVAAMEYKGGLGCGLAGIGVLGEGWQVYRLTPVLSGRSREGETYTSTAWALHCRPPPALPTWPATARIRTNSIHAAHLTTPTAKSAATARCRAESGGMSGCSSPTVLQHSLARAKEGSHLRPLLFSAEVATPNRAWTQQLMLKSMPNKPIYIPHTAVGGLSPPLARQLAFISRPQRASQRRDSPCACRDHAGSQRNLYPALMCGRTGQSLRLRRPDRATLSVPSLQRAYCIPSWRPPTKC